MEKNNKTSREAAKTSSQTQGADFFQSAARRPARQDEANSYQDLKLSVADMLKAGVHFGHKSSRWNPKMQEYIFGIKNGIHIIDLEKTLPLMEKAIQYLKNSVENGGKILFIGTKPQARQLIVAAASATEMPYVQNRWLGGTFSNFNEIKKRIKYLNDQEALEKSGDFKKYTKYEQSQIRKEIVRMNEKMGGIKNMDKMPQAVFIVDIKENALAVKESKKAGIPIVAIVDTNTDPAEIDFPIPANDDALSSLKYILGIVVRNVLEAKNGTKLEKEEIKEK